MVSRVRVLRLVVKSYDHRVLDASVQEIVDTARRTGARVRGPVPLPVKIKKYVVLRSPHIFKKARDQFEIRTHFRLIDLLATTPEAASALWDLRLPASVYVQAEYREEL